MSTNHTLNYGLCQWEAADKVLRTDFNADNAVIDTELGLLDTSMANLAYHTGYAALARLATDPKARQGRGVICDDFSRPELYTITGDAVVDQGMLTLTGAGKTADVTTEDEWSVGVLGWRRALLWVQFGSIDNLEVSINGRAATRKSFTWGYSPNLKKDCSEHLFVLDSPKEAHNGQIAFHMSASNLSTKLYGWFALFF